MINYYSAERYCRENISKIENYAKAIADNSQTWHLHHRRETDDPEHPLSAKELIARKFYYKRPAEELIFLTPSEHSQLHSRSGVLKKTCCSKAV